MSENNQVEYAAPYEAVTPRNLEKAIENLSGMKQSMSAIYEASHFPENQDIADHLLSRAMRIFEIGESMNASSPV